MSNEHEYDENLHGMEVNNASHNDHGPVEPEADPILPDQEDLLAAIEANNDNQNVQIGMVLTRFEEVDSVWSKAKQAEATRLWARFFSPGKASTMHTNIPTHWTNFFIVMLLSPNHFQWAKKSAVL
jgi:hypothetical protein